MGKEKINNETDLVNHEDDNEVTYDEFSNFLEKHTKREKHKLATDFVEMGENYLAEIEHKKNIKQKEKKPLIKYIIKKTNKYSEKYLSELDYNDVFDIYKEVKYENRSFLKKFAEFLGF